MKTQDQTEIRDALAELGPLALGSRLRRLADLLYRDAAVSLAEEGVNLSPNHVPLLMTLLRYGSMSVTEMAERLGTSQPGVTRMVSTLSASGVLALEKSKQDLRVSVMALTSTGRDMIASLEADYCHRVAAAATALYADAQGGFIAQIASVEAALAAESLSKRIVDAKL